MPIGGFHVKTIGGFHVKYLNQSKKMAINLHYETGYGSFESSRIFFVGSH